MSKAGVFVDDKDKIFARLLSQRGVLEFTYVPVDTELALLANRIITSDPAVVALDYRLDEDVGSLSPDQTYKASAVAQQLRDKAVASPADDFPIVLVSAEEKIKEMFDPDRTAHDLFDRVLVKEDINKDASAARTEILSLIGAYQVLTVDPRYKLETFLAAGPEDRIFVDIQELKIPVETAAAPHQVVGFVLKHLIAKPGLLLDAADAGARMGITPQSFEAVQAKLADAKLQYSGQLSDGWPRWWTHRLDAWLTKLLDARPVTLTASERAERLGLSIDVPLEAARSPWTGKSDEKIAFACASCRRGAEVRHSVNAFEGPLPRYRVGRRICWDCVQTDRYKSESPPLQTDELDEQVAADVRAMEKPAH